MADIDANKQTCTGVQLAQLLDLSKRRIEQLASLGVVVRAERGKYLVIASVNGYCKYIHSKEEEKTVDHNGEVLNFNMEKARKVRAEADLLELRSKEASGKFIAVEDVKADISEAVGICAKILGSLSIQLARIAPELPNRALDLIEKEQAKMLTAICDLDKNYTERGD